MTLSNLLSLLQTTPIELAKLVVSGVALVGTAVAVVIAFKSFRRAEKWKRAEFLANQMKEFFADDRVQKALVLIDWGCRRVHLLDETTPGQARVRVTRQLQVRALLPHTILNGDVSSMAEQSSEDREMDRLSFSPEQAAIRDCYDALLDGLERFACHVQSGLVHGFALRPYIGYWIDDIHSDATNPDDAAWSAALLTYIDCYGFKGVQWLFAHLDRSIACNGDAYLGFLRGMEDQVLAARLAEVVKIAYPVAEISAS